MVRVGPRSSAFPVVLTVVAVATTIGADGASPRSSKTRTGGSTLEQTDLREPVEVVKIVSGDTLIVGYKGRRQLVRLKGVSAPAKNNPASHEAAKHLRGLLQGKSIQMELGSPTAIERDERGRLVITLFADGENVNQQMMRVVAAATQGADSVLSQQAPAGPGGQRSDPTGKASSNASIGKKEARQSVASTPALVTVYVRAGDKAYHRQGCRLLRNAIAVPVPRTRAVGLGYRRCKRCKP